MKIDTKFTIGDWGYLLCENRIIQVQVNGLRVRVYESGTTVHYDTNPAVPFSVTEESLFRSKQDLVDSLLAKS